MKRFLAIFMLITLVLCACSKKQTGPNVDEATWQIQYDLGIRYLSEGNYEEAIIAFSAAIELNPEKIDAYLGCGDAYLNLCKSDDNLILAKECYEKAIRINPHYAAAYCKKSNVLVELGEYAEALKTLFAGRDATGSNEIGIAIQTIVDRISFSIEFLELDDKNYSGEIPSDNSYFYENEPRTESAYIVLTDRLNGKKQVVKSISIEYSVGEILNNDDVQIINNHEDTWLFMIQFENGESLTYLYTIHTNRLLALEPNLTIWEFYGDLMIGETMCFAVTDTSDVYIYSWEGEQINYLEEIIGGSALQDDYLYYIVCKFTNSKEIYNIYKMQLQNFVVSNACTVELPIGSYLCLSGRGTVDWYDAKSRTSSNMNLYELHDILMPDITNANETERLISEALEYIHKNYPDEGIIDLEFYAEDDEMISCRIVPDSLIYSGAEIEKSTRTVYLYNWGMRNIKTFLLPEQSEKP